MSLILGIDIGTTSLKTLIVDEIHRDSIVVSYSQATNANINHGTVTEQDTHRIVLCLNHCLHKIKEEIGHVGMSKISKVAICGQMHGCVLWKSSHIVNCTDMNAALKSEDVSNLITWQDGRCDKEFLQSLPVSNSSPLPLSTGFGCASLLWLKTHHPSVLAQYDCCGTIADYVVARLCKLSRPVMSDQNAVSWGYFNPICMAWDSMVMAEANFPTHLLPTVVFPGTTAGKIAIDFHGVSKWATVVVAMGDLQCSVKSCKMKPHEAVINLSTSAQISMLIKKLDVPSVQGSRLPKPVTTIPYFGDNSLVTSASLNGGAVFARFVQMLTRWTKIFDETVTEEMVYSQLTSSTSQVVHSELPTFVATLHGERHAPDDQAALTNIRPGEMNFADIARSISCGILNNLISMFETQYSISDIKHLWACGGAFKNKLFKEELYSMFKDTPISFTCDADAAYGAVLSV